MVEEEEMVERRRREASPVTIPKEALPYQAMAPTTTKLTSLLPSYPTYLHGHGPHHHQADQPPPLLPHLPTRPASGQPRIETAPDPYALPLLHLLLPLLPLLLPLLHLPHLQGAATGATDG